MARCAVHPTANAPGEATDTCARCRRAMCDACAEPTLDGAMCTRCARAGRSRRAAATWLKIGGLTALVTAVAIVGLVLASRGNDRDADGGAAEVPGTVGSNGYVPGDPEAFLKQLRRDRDQAPCDASAARALVRELNARKRFDEAVIDARRYLGACAPAPRLTWDVIYALQQLGRYPEAVALETALLADDLRDSDYWWWRGEDRSRGGEHAQGLADLRQSIANSDDGDGSRFAAGRILDLAVPAQRPCEAVAALNYFVAFHEGTLSSRLQRQANDLDLSEDCARTRGDGTIELPASDDPVEVRAAVVPPVGRAIEGRFVLDPGTGTTVITRAFAARAGISASGPAVDTVALGGLRTGPTATATLRVIAGGKPAPATAPATELAVVDELPLGFDGVIGLSALWKFEVMRTDDGGLMFTGTGQ